MGAAFHEMGGTRRKDGRAQSAKGGRGRGNGGEWIASGGNGTPIGEGVAALNRGRWQQGLGKTRGAANHGGVSK